MELKEFLEEVFERSERREGQDILIVKFLRDYLWRNRAEKKEIKAVMFRVEREGSIHNVVLTKKDGEWFMWCGDKYLREQGWDEEYCKGWRWRNGSKYCHHCNEVAERLLMDNKSRKKVEDFFDEGEKERESSRITDEFKIGYEEKLPVLLYGVTGSGKTHSVLEFVSSLNDVEFFQINMSSGLEDVDLLAKMIPDPESGKWTIRDGELWKAFKVAKEKPVIILIEELTRASKSARNLLLKAMDSVAGKYVLQNFVIGEQIEVPTENIWWIATANIGYSDTEELDPALMRRFLLTKFVDYDTEKEKEILSEYLSDEEVEQALKMVKALRRAYMSGRLAYPLDTGTLKTFGMVLAKVKDPMKSAEMTFMYRVVDVDTAGYPSEEQVNLIREIIEESFKPEL